MGKIVRAVKVKPLPAKRTKKMIGKKIVNKILQDATGEEIEFPEIADNDNIEIGAAAEINKKPASGEFVMPDGRTFVFSNGILKKIVPSKDEALAKIRNYLASKRNKTNPTAVPGNRFAGILNRYKESKRKNRK